MIYYLVIKLCGDKKAEEALQIVENSMKNNNHDKRLLYMKGMNKLIINRTLIN